MTAPTYVNFPHYSTHRSPDFGWLWEVTDGIGGRVLTSGHRLTRRRAETAAALAAARCRRWDDVIRERLAAAVALLHNEGIDVTARLDAGRVCVTPTCACSDRDHRRVMRAFLEIARSVRWEVPA